MNRREFGKFMAAAVAGMVAGKMFPSTAAFSGEGKDGKNGCAGMKKTKDDGKVLAKHACKGLNDCKGQGGCKSGDNGCAGKNSCKGKGGCKVPIER
ncbi:MAG: hypothetical protein D6795_04640 [Deltaproteobacteria bacterium]|nr:MAG: hypothetical protein D6795_04640 [Deltaproteobacteria bacterium]